MDHKIELQYLQVRVFDEGINAAAPESFNLGWVGADAHVRGVK